MYKVSIYYVNGGKKVYRTDDPRFVINNDFIVSMVIEKEGN